MIEMIEVIEAEGGRCGGFVVDIRGCLVGCVCAAHCCGIELG